MSYTKGPWTVNIKPARKYSCIFAGRNTHVCYLATDGLTDEEIEANCNLLAAAPEMLEALIAVARSTMPLEDAIDLCSAAIAHATGAEKGATK
jgi:hypothetical protein